MPPKQKGQNVRGRDKIFRNAVEHVHIGVGHAVLGNLSLQLAAGPPPPTEGLGQQKSTAPPAASALIANATHRTALEQQQAQAAALLADRPAFYLELNAQLLSHTSKDFKKFRWEVLELCETRPLFQHHRYEIAKKLLDMLMDRSGGSFTSRFKSAPAKKGDGEANRGETSEGFEAFARLTTAFVRDMQAEFFPFYEVFQEALQAGLFDRNGNFIADANRLQLVYSIQAAWCRELAPFWVPAASEDEAGTATTDTNASVAENGATPPAGSPQTQKLVRRIVSIYIRQLHDTKEYIRRLGAEWLAYFCRMCRPMVTLVCELASADVLRDFEAEALAEARAAVAQTESDDDDVAGDGEAADEEDGEGVDAAAEDEAAVAGEVAQQVWSVERLQHFLSHSVSTHPVVDGLGFFVAELFRGMRGSLSTSFERFYTKLLESFLLLDAAEKARIRKTLVRRSITADFLFSDTDNANDSDGDEDAAAAAAQVSRRKALPAATLHGGRWEMVFGNSSANADGSEEARAEGASCTTPDAIRAARTLVREVGAAALQAAMESLLVETRKHSASSHKEVMEDSEASSQDETGEDDEDDDGNGVDEAQQQAARLARRKRRMMLAGGRLHGSVEAGERQSGALDRGMDSLRPSHRLLSAVVTCLQANSPQHLRILATLLNAANYFLWNDTRELELLQSIAGKLRKAVGAISAKGSRSVNGDCERTSDMDFLSCAGALMELLYPLCATPYFDLTPGGNAVHNFNNSAAQDAKTRAWLLELQRAFLPAAKECVTAVSRIAYGDGSHSRGEAPSLVCSRAARKLLTAFAQDVLQKNFAFCLAEERRAAENAVALNGGGGASDSEGEEEEDSDGGDDNGVRRAAAPRAKTRRRRREEEESREDAFVEEEATVNSTRGLAATTERKAARTDKEAGAETVISSTLTPLALTLLHSCILASWTAANGQLEEQGATLDLGQSDHKRGPAVSVSIVDEALLLGRLALDRTRHMRACPLQQLLRLVSQQSKTPAALQQTEGPTAGSSSPSSSSSTSAGEEVSRVLERLLCRLVAAAKRTTALAVTPAASATVPRALRLRALDWLSVALPLVSVCVAANPTGAAAKERPAVADLKKGLLDVLRSIKSAAESTAQLSATGATSASYALYAKISVLLVTLAAGPKRKGVLLKGSKALPPGAAGATDASWQAEESLQHVSETISVLARGFREQQEALQQIANTTTTATSLVSNGADSDELDAAAVARAVPSEESRSRLFHGAELLLDALLAAMNVSSSALQEWQGPARQKEKRVHGNGRVSPATATALAALTKLRAALPHETQRQLVEVILLESLTAPSQPLRVLALRLLRLLCHPHTPVEARFAGVSSAVDVELFDALLAAEQFNPLSQTGNLDGVRQALAKVSFAAEAGTITDPTSRVLLARAMIGLLHVKFADAWPIALKILSSLVRYERTSALPVSIPSPEDRDGSRAESSENEGSDRDGAQDGEEEDGRKKAAGRGKALEPHVWDTVVCRYAHLLVLGDVLGREIALRAAHDVAPASDADEPASAEEEDDETDDGSSPAVCLYHLRFTHFQRHQKGELVSKAFSVAQYVGSPGAAGGGGGFALVDLAQDDDEVVTWNTHASHLLAASSSSAATSTDRATLAKTFLGALEEMMKSSSNVDRKLRLVEDVVLEMVAVQRSEHPGTSAVAGSVRRLDDRLAVAMRACSTAPTTVLTAQEQRRLPQHIVADLARRNARLVEVFLSYTSDTQGKLQRAAIDNLKRLKVEPFSSYHAQLTPYCADMKTLFNFLSSFHVETDIPAREQAEYSSCALTIALPKLIATVPKEKKRDQAVLRRRLLSFITHLSDRMVKDSGGNEREGGNAVAQVLDGLVQRLVLCRVASISRGTEGQPAGGRLAPADFDFPAMWEGWLNHALHQGGGGGHCTRKLERLCRQLLSTVQLLESLLHAVGTRFASYVTSCLHLLLQSYLLACKHELKKPLDAAVARDASVAAPLVRSVSRALSASTLSSALAQLRRASLTVVAQLFEQFPEDVMTSMETSPGLLYVLPSIPSPSSSDAAAGTIFGRYINALFHNSRGATHDAAGSTGGLNVRRDKKGGSGGSQAVTGGRSNKSTVTPVLRLMTAWSQSTALLPLLVLFPDVVVGTFADVFAVNGRGEGEAADASAGRGSAHRASSLALHQGLGCLNALLSLREEGIPTSYLRVTAVQARSSRTATSSDALTAADSGGRRGKLPATTPFGEAFLAPHIVTVFTSLYRLVVRGAEGDHPTPHGGGSGNDARDAGAAAAKRATRSIMSFKVTTWKNIMQTTSLLSRYITDSEEVKRAIANRTAAPPATADAAVDMAEVGKMLGKLAEVALHVVTHPACVADNSTALLALDVVDRLLREVPQAQFDAQRHFRPLVHLANVITLPESRLKLCGTLKYVLESKAVVEDAAGRYDVSPAVTHSTESDAAFQAQHAAVGRAVCCLNSFDENNENLARYDFELRYHTFHSLIHFFNNKGNYGALAAAGGGSGSKHAGRRARTEKDASVGAAAAVATDAHHQEHAQDEEGSAAQSRRSQAVRKEREYSGELDVRIPLHPTLAPLLSVEGFLALAANAVFLLRDPESTIRALATQLLSAMLRYAVSASPSSDSDRLPGGRATGSGRRPHQPDSRYAQLVLEEVVRREVLPSLRRGIVAKDVNIRTDHMVAFGAVGRYYPRAFPTFARLYSPNTEQNFFLNVGHVQPKCRLHALALLRKEAAELNVRDLLRVFVPFLLAAVKDFAQGKRDLRNLTESKAKGYCDAVLMTIAAITQKLPWEAYHRVLSLFLANANANPALRMPMLRGVVQVLNNFTFLDEQPEAPEEGTEKEDTRRAASGAGAAAAEGVSSDDDEADNSDAADADGDAEAALVAAQVRARRREFRHRKITHVLEQDILPQLFDFIGDGDKKGAKKALGLATTGGEFKGNQHSVTALRSAQQKEDKAASNTKNAILQLPVAIAITKIVKKLPEDRFNFYVDHVLDEVILKLRTKNDKHRDSARRILGALLRETGPGKLRFVLTKLKDNLVHGYQLHVLGYTVVTLLYQLYEPHSSLLAEDGGGGHARSGAGRKRKRGGDDDDGDDGGVSDPVLGAVKEAAAAAQKQRRRRASGSGESDSAEDERESDARQRKQQARARNDLTGGRSAAERDADDEVEAAEEELLAQLMPYYKSADKRKQTEFDRAYGVACLMDNMDDLMRIFLDDYLGEVGMQKEQAELMSTMVEVKRNRSLQGFSFIARHCEAGRVMESFLHKITWVLTPPTDAATVDAAQLHGSERARVLLRQEMTNKYLTVNKNSAGADLVFVEKVRLLATRVARGLMSNASMHVDAAFAQVRDLLDRHNAVREAKIKAFEARNGTRRIRGNAHLVIHKAQHDSWKEQLDKNFLVEPVPERVDADFSSHTVLATQQKQKLRVYKGRYGKQVREAAKDFYREDPTTAVVLDTLDEFLMKFLLSVLKRVLGIGKEAKYTAAAVQLDLLRRRRQQASAQPDEEGGEAQSGDGQSDSEEAEMEEEEEEEEEAEESAEDGEDDLDAFADAQQDAAAAQQEARRDSADAQVVDDVVEEDDDDAAATPAEETAQLLTRKRAAAKLSIRFTTEYRELLESLVPSVLTTLQGEGSDPVIANALDCLLALVSLRPPLASVHELNASLFTTVTSFFGRGGSIKQRAMRVCAAVIAHQPFKLANDQAAQLVRLVRAEIMDRSPFLPMSLSLFYAVLGKHSHVVEVYDLMDIITELMVHLSAKPVIVRKCILIFVRFLTEFKLTADKFRSHVDLLCKNLDYPELTGRLALLECLDTLISRLPVVVLRHEAPVLLVPLAATITSCEWKRCRERAGRVLQNMARLGGIDVLVPILSGWFMGERATRPQRTMAAQVWATMLPALAKAYHLPEAATSARKVSPSCAHDASEEEREAYRASCEWSLGAILDGCLFDQFKSAGVKLPGRQPGHSRSEHEPSMSGVSRKDRAAAEMKGWTLVFFSLRCAEAMLVALPDTFYPLLGARLLPAVAVRLITHTHPWVQAVAMRVLRHFCYMHLEQRCLYLQEPIAPSVARCISLAAAAAPPDETGVPEQAEAEAAVQAGSLPFVLAPITATVSGGVSLPRAKMLKRVWCPAALHTLEALAALLKTLLSCVGLSDVAQEQQYANRVLENDATRTESLKVMVYVSKAVAHVACSLLVATATSPNYQKQVKVSVHGEYASVLRHVHALVKPVLDQRAATNYVVRSATLVQFLGGFLSVLPQQQHSHEGEGEDEEAHAEDATFTAAAAMNEASRWLLTKGVRLLSFVKRTIRPLLAIGFAAGRQPHQRLLLTYTHQASNVIQQQLEERRALLTAVPAVPQNGGAADAQVAGVATGTKRPRAEEGGGTAASAVKPRKLAMVTSASSASHDGAATDDEPTLDAVLTELAASVAAVREERRDAKTAADTKRHLKRNRREREREEQHRRGPGGRMQPRGMASRFAAGGKSKMAVKKKFGGKRGK